MIAKQTLLVHLTLDRAAFTVHGHHPAVDAPQTLK